MNKYTIYYHIKYIRYLLIRSGMYHFPVLMVRLKYFIKLKRFFSLKHPKTYNEKNQWMKFYHNTQLMEKCADKLQLRDYLNDKGLYAYNVPILSIYNNYSEIEFDKLPDQFVLKTNHGSGMNQIILNKSKINHLELEPKFNYYLRIKYSEFNHELVYQNIVPQLFVEPYLGEIIDYKIMCVNHKILYTVSLKRYPDGHYDEGFYDSDWNKSLGGFKHINVLDPSIKPKQKEVMNRLALIIAKDFLQVRVDFYEIDNKVYISECTFYSESGMLDFKPQSVDIELGKKFILPFEYSV
jgi:hypothetical protein